MSIRYTIDWNLPLQFDIGNWQIGTEPSWAPSYPNYYGLYNNDIGDGSHTAFTITTYWEYLEIDYVVSSESRYDFIEVIDTTASSYLVQTSGVNNTPITYSKTFDGSLRTIEFRYRKDGSSSSGFDSCMILRMVVQTANDELVQFIPYFALKDNDTNNLYIVQDNSLVQIDIDLESADYDAITSTFMLYSQDVVEAVLALNTFENASIISLDMSSINRVWCEYYAIKPTSILMDNTARDYTAHEYVEDIDTINIQSSLQEGDSIGVAIGIDDDLWVLNNVDSEGNVITYTTEELTPELIIELGFNTRNPVPDNIKSQLLMYRKLKFAYVIDVNSINSQTALLDVRGAFVTTLAASEEQN
jgi:hypothetical protein